jgi:hypothetical protein
VTSSSPPLPVALIGVGEMGGVFARAFLRLGHPVQPVLRSSPIDEIAARLEDPLLALGTVGEADLPAAMAALPDPWRARAGLIQNELLPRDWQSAGLIDPTVAVVWFEKKQGRDVKVIIPSPVAGPAAASVKEALATLDIPAVVVDDRDALEHELIRKNLYILTANIAGIVTGGTVGELWADHRRLASAVAAEVLEIQSYLVGHDLDGDRLVAGMVEAFEADPDHGATGRSAPKRLSRALSHAGEAGIETPWLTAIQHGNASPA